MYKQFFLVVCYMHRDEDTSRFLNVSYLGTHFPREMILLFEYLVDDGRCWMYTDVYVRQFFLSTCCIGSYNACVVLGLLLLASFFLFLFFLQEACNQCLAPPSNETRDLILPEDHAGDLQVFGLAKNPEVHGVKVFQDFHGPSCEGSFRKRFRMFRV